MERTSYVTINIREKGFKEFVEIHNSRPQDRNRSDTFEYLIQIYNESQKPKPKVKK
jgi:hypothetical protein